MKNKWKPQFCNVGKPFPYLIVDNWYNKFEENAIWKELEFLTSRGRDNSLRAEDTIVASIKGKPLGRSYRYYLADIFNYENRTSSNILRFLKKQQSKEFHDLLFKTFPHAINFVSTNQDSSLVSYYENNDVYNVHTDTFQELVQETLKNSDISEDMSIKIDSVVSKRLDELNPKMVKGLVQDMIKEHLGWLVVWGGVFGGLIGLVGSLLI